MKFLLWLLIIGGIYYLLKGLFFRSLFGGHIRTKKTTEDYKSTATTNRDKVFGDNEGEYVDFEEIKEPEKEKNLEK